MTSSENSPLFPAVGVLALVPDQWGPQWQTRHHVLSRLARYFEVVWMNYPPSWRQIFSKRNSESDTLPLNSLQVYTPERWLPEFGRPAWLANWTLRERLRRGRERLLRRGCRHVVLYMWRPHLAPGLSLVSHDLSCYHIDDEYSYSPRELPLNEQEAELMRKVGQVFIHSPAMMEKKGWLNPNTRFVPNGVEYERYASASPEPEDLRQVPFPRIGYAGILKSQMDWPLLMELSAKHGNWSFVFVGAPNASWNSGDILPTMSKRPNVYFLGAKTTQELAQYPQHFQVCLLPYRIDGYTKFIYPLKLHEYLASGTPVVGSPLQVLKDFAGVVSVAASPEEWSRSITQALSATANSPEARARRQVIAQDHDWDKVVSNIAETMLERLGIRAAATLASFPAHEGGRVSAEIARSNPAPTPTR